MTPIRVTDLAITPDFTRLVTIGMDRNPSPPEPSTRPGVAVQAGSGSDQASGTGPGSGASAGGAAHSSGVRSSNKMIIYDLATKQPEL